MDQSLSIILPVHNAEQTLARQVNDLLEVVPELTSRFEVLIVDDGSTDQTEEVAHDLSRQFPQLHVARHSCRQGAAGAVITALQRTSGDVLFVHDGRAPVRTGELRRMWELREDEQLVMARSQSRTPARPTDLAERLEAWWTAVQGASSRDRGDSAVQMIRRHAIEGLQSIAIRDAG